MTGEVKVMGEPRKRRREEEEGEKGEEREERGGRERRERGKKGDGWRRANLKCLVVQVKGVVRFGNHNLDRAGNIWGQYLCIRGGGHAGCCTVNRVCMGHRKSSEMDTRVHIPGWTAYCMEANR